MLEKVSVETISISEIPAACLMPEPVVPKSIVLIADDEALIADTLAAILEQNEILALTAYDGQSAFDLAQLIPPDLLLSDVVMPDMSGIDLAIAMQDSLPHCQILLFSGQAATKDLLSSAREIGHHFVVIEKPIHPGELLRRISDGLKSSSI